MGEQKNRKTAEDPAAKEKAERRREAELDEELDETFPASDPPAATQPKAPRKKSPGD